MLCIGLELTICNTNYMLSGYLPTYLKTIVGLPANAALVMILLAMAFASIAVVFVARLSDRIGVKPLIATGCGLLFAGSIPAFTLIRFGSNYPTKFLGVLIIGLMLLCLNSIEPSTLPALFPANVRYGGVSIGYNIAVSGFGGTIPLVAQTLISATGNAMMPAYMLMFAGVAGTITLIFTPEVAGRTLPESAPTVESVRRGPRISPGHRSTRGRIQILEPSPAIKLIVTARTTAPSRYDSSAWRSTVDLMEVNPISVSETWKVMPTCRRDTRSPGSAAGWDRES